MTDTSQGPYQDLIAGLVDRSEHTAAAALSGLLAEHAQLEEVIRDLREKLLRLRKQYDAAIAGHPSTGPDGMWK